MKEIKLTCKPLVAIDGEIFEKDVILYECQKDSSKVFKITSKSESDCKVSLQIDGKQAYFLLNDKNEETQCLNVSLKSKKTLEIPIYLKHGDKCGENYICIEAITDYSSSVKKEFTIKTKRSFVPKPLFDFTFIDDDDIYYIGEGDRKMGKLTVKAGKQEDCQITDAYSTLDLKNLKCSNELISIKLLDDVSHTLSLGDSNECNIYFHSSKKGEVSFFFSIGLNNKSKSFIIKAKDPKEPIEYMEFIPVKDLRYDLLKDNHIVGYLNTSVINTDKRGVLKRENGYFELTDRLHSFDYEGKSQKQVLEFGKKTYPIYANVKDLFGSLIDNIDEDKLFHINSLLYSDILTTDKEIYADYEVKHIEAHPISCISVIDASGKESPIEGLTEITLEEWKYDSIYARQISSANFFSLCLGNSQSIAYNGNGIIWEEIHVEGDGIIEQYIYRKEIRNGERNFQVPIKVKFDKIKNKSEIKVFFRCKEIINDADIVENTPRDINCAIVVPVMEVIVDDWYSIDLGTTGIVVAKWNSASETDDSDGISAIELEDSDKPIESSNNIVSSITILKPSSNDKNIGEIVVAPSTTELKQSAKHVLVPTKFMVGQDVLPFINTYRKTFPGGLLLSNKKYDWEEISPEEILKYTYNTIFSKISEDECNKIRKLIITYPNTYTPQSLDWLRNMIITSGIFENLSERSLHFIPESDSVVAYYVKRSMEREVNEAIENVVIYDMGAGTLDLSYVKICVEQENGKRVKKSTIEKRIGIPIAGEYFSYLIYEYLKDKFVDTTANYTTKGWVENFKKEYGKKTKLGDIKFGEETIINSSYANEDIKLGDAINRWINICTNDAFVQLLGNNWGDSVNRIVLSGRGSQFKPIQAKLNELAEKNEIMLDLETIPLSELKQCVAEGAILYQKIFENSSMPFSILHRNSYERVGIKYRIIDDNFTKKWVYKELMTENNLIWDTCTRDGALFAQVPPFDIENLDFRLDEDVIFYLTTLSEEEMQEIIKKPGSEKEAFINELFRFKPRELTSTGDREKCVINLGVDSNNVLKISINSMDLLPHSTLPNVEDDKFYVKCNWYFNN